MRSMSLGGSLIRLQSQENPEQISQADKAVLPKMVRGQSSNITGVPRI